MKRLLFFPGHRLFAYEWERGRFRRVETFEPDEQGRRAFQAWLEEAPRTPVQLLLDVIEEEFHIDHVPHVIGRDRAELYRRTARKHFRSTDFHYITAQGRRPTGRRDDEVLIAGLTNPEILKGWLSVIDAARVPLKGIHSLPLVGERLLGHLGAPRSGRVLVVTQQVPSTLRQSYYEHGRLKFSRLVPGRYDDAEGYLRFVRRELDQTLHFLETQRFRRRQEPVDVFVVVGDEFHDTLRDGLSSSDSVTVHLAPLASLARRVGIRGEMPRAFADTIFAQVLLRQARPPNHYGLRRLRRHFFAQRARIGLRWAAGALVVGAVALAGSFVLRGQVYEQGMREAKRRATEFERLYQQRLHQLDEFRYRAVDVKNAVDLLSDLSTARPEHPGPTMAAVGNVLAQHPHIVVDSLDWQVSTDPDRMSAGGGERAAGAGTSLAALALRDRPAYYYALVKGDVIGFQGDYRRAVELFDGFVGGLRDAPPFAQVGVVEAPFDLKPDSGVSGDSGTTAGSGIGERASYAVRLRRDGEDHGGS